MNVEISKKVIAGLRMAINACHGNDIEYDLLSKKERQELNKAIEWLNQFKEQKQ